MVGGKSISHSKGALVARMVSELQNTCLALTATSLAAQLVSLAQAKRRRRLDETGVTEAFR